MGESTEEIKLKLKLKIALKALKAINDFNQNTDEEFSDASEIARDALRKIEMIDAF